MLRGSERSLRSRYETLLILYEAPTRPANNGKVFVQAVPIRVLVRASVLSVAVLSSDAAGGMVGVSREPRGRDEEREDVDGEGLGDGVLTRSHQPGHACHDPPKTGGSGPELGLHVVGDLLKEKAEGRGIEQVSVGTAAKIAAPIMLEAKTTAQNWSILRRVLL